MSFLDKSSCTCVDVKYGACDIVRFFLERGLTLRGGLPTNVALEEAFLAYQSSGLLQRLS